jgi:hypothetical protein
MDLTGNVDILAIVFHASVPTLNPTASISLKEVPGP